MGTKTILGRGRLVSKAKQSGESEINHIELCVDVPRLCTNSRTFDARITAGLKSSLGREERAQTDGERNAGR